MPSEASEAPKNPRRSYAATTLCAPSFREGYSTGPPFRCCGGPCRGRGPRGRARARGPARGGCARARGSARGGRVCSMRGRTDPASGSTKAARRSVKKKKKGFRANASQRIISRAPNCASASPRGPRLLPASSQGASPSLAGNDYAPLSMHLRQLHKPRLRAGRCARYDRTFFITRE